MKPQEVVQMKKNEALNKIKAIITRPCSSHIYESESISEEKFYDIKEVIRKLELDIYNIKKNDKQK